MAKQKKLSFKFFINTSLQPVVINGKAQFPLYVRVTYNRKSTSFRVHDIYESPIMLPENDDIESLLSKEDYRDTQSLYHIRDLVTYEEKLLRERHSIIGIGDRMNSIYIHPIIDHLRGHNSFFSYMIAQVGREWLALDQVYDYFKLYHIAKFDIPDIKSQLPENVANILYAEILLQLYSQKEGKDLVMDIRTYQWIGGALRDHFRDFLLRFSPTAFSPEELKQTAGFFNDFPFKKSSIDKYLTVIDFAIESQVLWNT
ncbi:MAG: hypothetical protein KDD01_26840 [Phaeodactylibacter sp.]|nr:hypothetical protein [Phaeodactylibacter sp.]